MVNHGPFNGALLATSFLEIPNVGFFIYDVDMKEKTDFASLLIHEDREKWYEAHELNYLLLEQEIPEEMYWRTTHTGEWDKLRTVTQVPAILLLVQDWGETFSFENEEPITKYAQGTKLSDGNYTLELAVVRDKAYNMRIGIGPNTDFLSSEPDDEVPTGGQQSLSIAQVSEVLGQWLLGKGLPAGYGGSIRIYG